MFVSCHVWQCHGGEMVTNQSDKIEHFMINDIFVHTVYISDCKHSSIAFHNYGHDTHH